MWESAGRGGGGGGALLSFVRRVRAGAEGRRHTARAFGERRSV